MKYNIQEIENAIRGKEYLWFDKGDYNLNIIGVRNSSTNNRVTNSFDDLITLSYKINGNWNFHSWEATTEPGLTGVMEFENIKGVSILVPNQYRGAYAEGLHKNQYEALVQIKTLKVWRDKNKDMIYDHDVIDNGIFGINIHHAGTDSIIINNWSYGCQVFKKLNDFLAFMKIIEKAKEIYGNSFTYTLIESSDIK
jgi:hypothetical protein